MFQTSAAERRCSGSQGSFIALVHDSYCARSNSKHSIETNLWLGGPDMRNEPLLTAVPPAPVRSLSELYAIAFDLAERAAQRYGALAERIDETFLPVRCVFEVLMRRERDRADSLSAACLAACGKRPDIA